MESEMEERRGGGGGGGSFDAWGGQWGGINNELINCSKCFIDNSD